MASINTSVGNFTPIESSENITIQTELVPTNAGQMESDINLRRTLDDDGSYTTTKVGDFDEIGYISLIGEYPQNRIDIPRYDLSKVVSLGTDIANFNFILSLKVGDEEPKLFANKNVMIDLIAKYGKKEPIPVNYLINERKIVLIQLEPLNLLTEQMIATELSINLNSNKNVEVSRNLFTYTNYVSDEDGKLLANPSYDLNELIKYITWVVTKPNQNYDDRLLPSNVIGEWVSTINTETNTETGEDEPSTDTTNVPPPPSDTGSGNQGGSGNTGSYEPVGRAGTSQGEVVVLQTQPYLWDGTRWLRVTL
tara:strand:+ start:471 stop:1397 length:927 start_codon:yes stop_codon:yes gene_type:complete